MTNYHYTECGLDNVILCNIDVIQDDGGKIVTEIPSINRLHKELARAVITSEGSIDGKELRFLRTEMGLTQDELAQRLHKDRQTIGRWERGEVPIDNADEIIIRLMVAEECLDDALSVAEVGPKCLQKASKPPIKIDGSDPKNYRYIEPDVAA